MLSHSLGVEVSVGHAAQRPITRAKFLSPITGLLAVTTLLLSRAILGMPLGRVWTVAVNVTCTHCLGPTKTASAIGQAQRWQTQRQHQSIRLPGTSTWRVSEISATRDARGCCKLDRINSHLLDIVRTRLVGGWAPGCIVHRTSLQSLLNSLAQHAEHPVLVYFFFNNPF